MGVYWKEIRYFISISICFWASALTCHQIGIPLICILMHCSIYEEQVCYQGGFIILSMYNFNAYNIKKWCPNKRHSHNSRKYLVVVRSKCTNILQETYKCICCLSQGYKILYKLRNPDIWARPWDGFCTAQYFV